jgi:hypothetical protein
MANDNLPAIKTVKTASRPVRASGTFVVRRFHLMPPIVLNTSD